jgi:hypothetical protein
MRLTDMLRAWKRWHKRSVSWRSKTGWGGLRLREWYWDRSMIFDRGGEISYSAGWLLSDYCPCTVSWRRERVQVIRGVFWSAQRQMNSWNHDACKAVMLIAGLVVANVKREGRANSSWAETLDIATRRLIREPCCTSPVINGMVHTGCPLETMAAHCVEQYVCRTIINTGKLWPPHYQDTVRWQGEWNMQMFNLLCWEEKLLFGTIT